MDKELEDYYAARIEMFSTKGWKDLMEDLREMINARNQLDGISSAEDFRFAKGELSVMKWLSALESTSRDVFRQLEEDDAPL